MWGREGNRWRGLGLRIGAVLLYASWLAAPGSSLAQAVVPVIPLVPIAPLLPASPNETDAVLAPLGPTQTLPQLSITAPEPRYVSPTRHDHIGRIWAPVFINGRGPFRLVLDTGASHSGVTVQVAQELGIPLDRSPPMMLQGVTGRAQVPAIKVDNLSVGDLLLAPAKLPIVTDALGGAEGVLGGEGLSDKRIYIDFRHDQITITRSRNERAGARFMTIPWRRTSAGLLEIDATVAGVPVKAIIDTGGQTSIGNVAMRDALYRRALNHGQLEHVEGVTTDVQIGESFAIPPIEIGPLEMRGVHVTYGDMNIFEHWKLTREPAVLIGMDAIGTLDVVIIDYHRRELQLRLRDPHVPD